jgi:hypothetical protein
MRRVGSVVQCNLKRVVCDLLVLAVNVHLDVCRATEQAQGANASRG